MKKYVCDACGWVYDEEVGCEEKGIPAGTKFEDLPDDFELPKALKSIFCADFIISLEELADIEEARKDWVEECFNDEDDE